MALQLTFTDSRTNIYGSSYWRIERIVDDKKGEALNFIFNGYKDASTATLAKNDNKIQAIGTQTISVRNNDYLTTMSGILNDSKNPYDVGYSLASGKSFFSGAVVV